MSNRKITDMVALTTPASEDVLPIIDISEAAAADKNKKISIEELFKGVPNGTAAAPSVAFESDDDSGIFLAGTNTVGITTAGTQRVTVDSSGNVGIGTSSPSSGKALTLNSSSNYYGINFQTAGTNIGNIIQESTGAFYISTNQSSGQLIFRSGAQSEAMRIDSSGRVGIGLTPTAPLHVGGTIQSQAGSSVAQMYADGGSANFTSVGAYPAIFRTNGAERLRISSAGLVGIGTSTPGVKLAVAGTDAIQVPAGTTAQRPTAAAGQIRLNTTHGYYEGYDGTNWTNLRTLVQTYLPSGTQACDSTTLATIDVVENNESYSDSLTTESAGVYTFARAGLYEIYIRLTVNGTADNYRWTSRLRATKNGTSTVVGEVEGGYLRGNVTGQSTACFVTMAFTHQFAASDTLTFQIQRISGVSGSATIQVEGTNVIIKALKTTD